MATRKHWKTQPPLMSLHAKVHRSMPEAYRHVRAWADEYCAGTLASRIQSIEVWVDEGDGWRLYETVRLADLPKEAS
jgi:hypothetical protein